MRVWGGVVAALLVLTCAASANAAVARRYVSVAGTGTACTPSEPCSLRYAAANSATGDEVIVAAGTYSATPPIKVPDGSENVYIHGEPAGPMPRVEGTMPEAPPITFVDTGGRLSYIEVVNVADSGYGASCLLEGTLERVKIVAVGQDAIGLYQGPGCYLRDSLVRTEGPGSVALYTTDSETSEAEVTEDRNVTAVARGPGSIGSWLNFLGVGPIFKLSLMLRNSIAKGERYDLYGTGSATLSHYKSQILAANSDFDSVVVPDPLRVEFKDGGGNRSAAPLFVDPAHGDYREAEGSPTIDGGAPQEVGRLDLAGGPRIIGEAPDMGAFEFVPGPASTLAGKTGGRLRALSIEPEKFHPFLPGHGDKPPQPRGTTVSYRLSAAGHVRFTVEEKAVGRVVKGKCLRKTHFNSYGKKCPLILPLRGSIGRHGKAGRNRFRFPGYFAGEPLPRGRYRLVGTAGGVTKRASFTILE
jgi:hypothetical protein